MTLKHCKLGQLVTIKTGKLDANAANENGVYPFFTCAKESLLINQYAFDADAILVAGNGDLNVKHYKGKFNAYQRTYVITVNDPKILCTRYLFHFMSKYVDKLREQSIGGVIKYIKLGMLTDAIIPLPAPEEQKRIAAILDKADAIRQKRQQAIVLTDDFLRSVFLDMFGDPVTNPKGWDIYEVGSVVDCIVPGRDKPKSFSGDIPWVTTNDLSHLGITTCSKANIGLAPKEIREVNARVIPKGSVVMTCVGDLGLVSIAGCDFVMNQQLHAFIPSKSISNIYLMYALSFQKNHMLKMASSTTVPYMNKKTCNSVPICMVPPHLQDKFEKIYEITQAAIKKYSVSQQNKFDIFESIYQKAFSGQL